MKRIKSVLLAVIIVTAVATASVISLGQTEAAKKVISVVFGKYSVYYNNQNVTSKVSPAVINGTTYIPLRAVSNIFNKNLSLQSKSIYLSDKADPAVSSLQSQVSSLNSQISSLTDRNRTLENTIIALNAKLASTTTSSSSTSSSSSSSSISISDLEDDLNDDYESYKDAEFDITLSGNTSKVTITIKTDEDEWKDLGSSYQRKYLEKVIAAIHDEYTKATITGKVKDGSAVIVEFTATSTSDNVIINEKKLISNMQDDLQNAMEDGDFGKLTGIDNDDLEIVLEGDLDDLTFQINIDLDDYDDEWDDLTDDSIEAYMIKVYDYIVDDSNFKDTDVVGYFHDSDGEDNLAKLYNESDSFKTY